eukprot:3766392-Prymnesium_polylepis.2
MRLFASSGRSSAMWREGEDCGQQVVVARQRDWSECDCVCESTHSLTRHCLATRRNFTVHRYAVQLNAPSRDSRLGSRLARAVSRTLITDTDTVANRRTSERTSELCSSRDREKRKDERAQATAVRPAPGPPTLRCLR